MKIHDVMQRSTEWLQLHVGIPTASDFDNLITPKFEIRKGKTPDSYLARKIAEAWQGGPLPGFSSWATNQGNLLEPEAIPKLAFETGLQIQQVGFITRDDGRVGCSPD